MMPLTYHHGWESPADEIQAERCTFHKRTRRLPRSRQEPQRRAALDRGQAPATRGTTSDFTSDAAKAAVAASLVSRMAFVFSRKSNYMAGVRGCGTLSAGSVPSWRHWSQLRAPRLIIALKWLIYADTCLKRGRTTSIRQESKKRRSSDPRQVVVMSMMFRSLQQC